MEGTLIPVSKPLPPSALEELDAFRFRFRQLWDNWASLKAQGIRLGGSFSNLGDGRVTGPGCGIEIHRLKGLYLDFRVFWSQDDKTQYLNVASLLGKHCSDGRFRRYLVKAKEDWNHAGLLSEWHGVTPDEMFKVIFNGVLFHTEPKQRERLRYIQSLMTDDLAHHCLVYSVYMRLIVIRNLNWVIEPLMLEQQYLRLPKKGNRDILLF